MKKLQAFSKPVIERDQSLEFKLFSLLSFVFFFCYRAFPSTRVGDGSEYILQYESFIESKRPWITQAAVKSYDVLFAKQEFSWMVSSSQIKSTFPSLAVGDSFDLNHFWFYSALAALIHMIFRIIFIDLSVASSFILLHAFLFTLVARLAWKKFGKFGILASSTLLFVSPLFWYGNKIHTEFFTFCLISLASISVLSRDYHWGAFYLAVASTQNPSFAAIAFALLIFQFAKNDFKSINFRDGMIAASVIFISILHPAYYLWRQGIISPQLKAGGASLGSNLNHFFIWIIDPDVGLLPNWPYGCLILLLFLTWRKKVERIIPISRSYYIFVALFLAISLYAQSSTTNLNSGGTPGLSRYALWYVGLFFPLALTFLINVGKIKTTIGKILVTSTTLTLALSSIYCNVPLRPEHFTSPSISSRFIQTHLPKLYTPPAPIFVGRYSGIGEALSISAVVGPDCHKILVLADSSRLDPIAPANCLYSKTSLQTYVANKILTLKRDSYFELTEKEIIDLRLNIKSKVIRFSENSEGVQLLGPGWSNPEPWGTWSNGSRAEITLPCKIGNENVQTVKIFLNAFGKQLVSIRAKESDSVAITRTIEGSNQLISLKLSQNSCVNSKYILIWDLPNAKSPLSLGLSPDSRILGVGLIQMILG
jgi:hypothetical protein